MNTTDLKDRYLSLYDYMAQSRDPKNMKAFGTVMTQMMDYLIQAKPDVAEDWFYESKSICVPTQKKFRFFFDESACLF